LVLDLRGITAGYGAVTVLRDVDFQAEAGHITCIMGRNGAGKSTLLRAIMGLVDVTSGTASLDGQAFHDLPAHQIPSRGIAIVPQGRRLFGPLTVAENLEIGGLVRGNAPATRERVLAMFPRLRERLGQVSATLSGGEQQMLAIARALCLEPRVLLLDEPTEGLQPSIIALIREVMTTLRDRGVAVVLVEHKVEAVLKLADRVAFMANGRVVEAVAASDLTAASPQFRAHVGV
jgi:branched-chain amino acid transport system ATP-binding protein